MSKLPQNVTIVGSGTQGSMLAFRSAAFGRKVCLYDLSEEQLSNAMAKIKGWFGDWVDEERLSPDMAATAFSSMRTTSNLDEALRDCDIIIENVPEVFVLKAEGMEGTGPGRTCRNAPDHQQLLSQSV